MNQEIEFKIRHQVTNPADRFEITEEWLKDAKLYLFSSEEVGQVSFPFEISNLDLDKS